MKRIFFFIMLASSICAKSQVNLDYYLPKNTSFNKAIPVPSAVVGHEVGEWHITHDKLVSYMKELAKASDRISIEERGETFEGRPLLLLKITSKENQLRIEEIKKNHIEITDNESFDVSKEPIIVYQGFSIHGNESSGANAALVLAYYLAAAEGDDIENLLDNVVVLLDPVMNPDGLQRFAYWANTNKSNTINSDPNDREFHEVWPGGRTNHYWFDMNRDWLPVQLPESIARIKTFHDWLPNILTDHHEMGTNSTFFFQPGIPQRTNSLTPLINQELTKKIGNYHAQALDKIGSLYYSEEDFDDFYYGKGSTFPDINGSIGILFEQGSSRGHSQESENGVLTFPYTIRNQFITSLSTLDAALDMRTEILHYQQEFFKKSRSLYEDKALVFGDEKDLGKTNELAKVLKKHKIELHAINNDFEINGKNFKKNYSYAIPLNQKNNRLIKAMFDVKKIFKDSLFYDVSAWTFDAAFGVDLVRDVPLNKIGKEVKELYKKKGSVTTNSNIGYLMSWNEYYTPRVLYKILEKGLRAKVSMKNFKNNGKSYDYGTIFIPVQNQNLSQRELFMFLDKIAKENNLSISGVSTGQNIGIDLGSRNFKAIKKPKVAMLVGKGIKSYDAGEVWHMLDQRFDMKLTKLDTDNIKNVNLDKYSVIIIPNSTGISQDIKKNIGVWINKGGVLIGYKNTLNWLKKRNYFMVDFKYPELNEVKNIAFEQRKLLEGAQLIGGAIFKARIDRSHPINFGYKNNEINLFRNSTIFMKPDKKSYNNPIQYINEPLVSGYVSAKNLNMLKNTIPLKIQPLGKGKVIGFTDNTNFRGFWFGTNKLLLNAIFFNNIM